ncbi:MULTISPECIES: DUF6879 family protein [unclassified Streptomyces]|uniref:DUF6879 family protein n=1 Tax=unclassified Streptomyces TaxID=2593676 RepID=UPI00081E6511|nr:MULTISPECIES: DUF6879 family protein [unclassified Streptomyces]MYZ36509.1 hypothetical protein [Streptomyces sp. SID4917]SCF84163.1 hypothetical protein GA0115259_103478 [Streptomyces sp. MnatMP-M17]
MSSTEFSELIARAKQSAVHLEMRDSYFTNPRFEAWRQGHRVDWADRASWWRPFHQQIADAVARGVSVRRARVVSEPVTEYIRWEHYVTHANVAAGEQVRWLSRRLATDLVLPANDFWIFDDQLMRVHHFSGNGDWLDKELHDDPQVVEACSAAFEKIWERAIPHDEYEIR